MKADSWKKIIDGIDEDIVDSAAEKLSRTEHSAGIPGEFSDNGKTTEYRYPAKKKRGGLYIGVGSAACRCGSGGLPAAESRRTGDVSAADGCFGGYCA